MSVSEITPQQLRDVLEQDAATVLVDVRPRVEFRRVHVSGAQNIPFDELSVESLSSLPGFHSDATAYMICKAGVRSVHACEKLAAAGYSGGVSVQGGTDACVSAGIPVRVSDQQGMSLERQVRLVAGAIVAISSVLALTVNPYFAGVAAFVGAGLVFAAVTDSCAMGVLLAKMPWNR